MEQFFCSFFRTIVINVCQNRCPVRYHRHQKIFRHRREKFREALRYRHPMAVGVNPKNIFLRSDPDVADWPIKNCTKKDPAEFFSIFFIRHYLLKKKSSIRLRSSTVQYAQFLSTVISYKFLNNIYFLCKKK